ncbi:hypothetical protein BHE74_00033503, partial [Ensete ventricosum]
PERISHLNKSILLEKKNKRQCHSTSKFGKKKAGFARASISSRARCMSVYRFIIVPILGRIYWILKNVLLSVKTRAELEEIALAEADVARLKQKVAELHLQLNQQRQNHYGSIPHACDRYQHLPAPRLQQ